MNKKCKLDRIVPKKPSFRPTPLVGVHLANFEDSGPSEESKQNEISSSKHPSSWKTRTLEFSREYPILSSKIKIFIFYWFVLKLNSLSAS